MAVQRNRMRTLVERGEVQIGTWLNMVRDPGMLMLLKSAGLDFARVDMEHTGASIEAIATLAVVARALDFPIVVRPPRANREWITRLLDVGVYNLHCPQVESAAHAREIVAASRFAPRGQRGLGGLGPGTDFDASLSLGERKDIANREVFVTVMFETDAAFADLEEIAAMDGIDALTIGPHDLAQNLGVLGAPEEKAVLDERRRRVLEAAGRHGKTSAMLVNSPEQTRQWRDAGALLLAYSNEVEVLHEAYSRAMQALRA
jgi:2-keto-3-deoxy-L-rhamnonate aldolase RhmA